MRDPEQRRPRTPAGTGEAGEGDSAVLRIAEEIADGGEIDWVEESCHVGSASDEERAFHGLRVIADAFRRLRDEGALDREPTKRIVLFRWGRLDVLEALGKGGFGEVYRAYDPQLDRQVALKLLHGTDAGTFRALSEARRLARIRHPNVLTIHGADVHQDQAGLWTDLLEGRTLNELVRTDGPRGAHEAAGVGVDLCRALAAIHGAQLVHGDVKPSNVMREVGGRIVLMDFGSAREQRAGDAAPVQATLATAAPEVLAGATPTARADLYSLGATLFFLLSGSYPRAGARSHLRDLRPDLPAEIVDVVERTLQSDPGSRPASAGELEESLRRAGGISTPLSGARSEVRDAVSPARATFSGRAALALLALGLLGVLALLSFDWLRGERDTASPMGIEGQRLISDFPGSSRAATFSPDGGMIVFLNDRTGVDQVWVRPVDGGPPAQATTGESAAGRPRWSRRGEIVYERAGDGIWAVAALGGEPRRLLEEGRSPDVSPDGSRLVFQRRNALWLADLDGGSVGRLEAAPHWFFSAVDAAPAFAPDGSAVAYFHQIEGPLGDIFLVDLESGDRRQLTFDLTEAGDPVFTSDGGWIVFSSLRSGSRLLWRVAVEGGEPVPVTTGAGEDSAPALSADPDRLAYTNVRHRSVLEAFDPQTGSRREILASRALLNLPRVSPSGDRVAYFQQLGAAGVHLFVVPAAGGDPVQLTSNPGGQNIHPRWSPDGRHLYYYDSRGLTFRRMPADGGPSETVFEDWHWQRQNSAEISPDGTRVLYTELGGETERTWIRALDGSDEPLGLPLPHFHGAQWSDDGLDVIGWRHDGHLALPPRAAPMRRHRRGRPAREVRRGRLGDLFHRPAGEPDRWRLFHLDLESGVEREVGVLGPHDPLSATFSVTPAGEIVSTRFETGRRELWLATLR
ncbi:MAG TPA: protein kinase [Thermoanaerobaculia bacterium]|nr:protein kinase [Thermoanaerobaculia bacterium]